MAAEGEYPKTDGDILYGSEVNTFNTINGTPAFEDATGYTIGSAGMTTFYNLTFSGAFDGKALATIEVNGLDTTGDNKYFQALDNADKAIIHSQLLAAGTGIEGSLIFNATIKTGDVIELQMQRGSAGTVSIGSIVVFHGIPNGTVSGASV